MIATLDGSIVARIDGPIAGKYQLAIASGDSYRIMLHSDKEFLQEEVHIYFGHVGWDLLRS